MRRTFASPPFESPFSGSHATGKSSLISELARRIGGLATIDELYYVLEAEGHAFETPPSASDFELLLGAPISLLADRHTGHGVSAESRSKPCAGLVLRAGDLAPALAPPLDSYYSKDMARITSKLQVSIPKRIADEYGIAPGDEIEFVLSGGSIRVVKAGKRLATPTTDERLELFDRATARQKARQRATPRSGESGSGGRGWSRDSLYDRGRAR